MENLATNPLVFQAIVFSEAFDVTLLTLLKTLLDKNGAS
jgi:hypothetical protein